MATWLGTNNLSSNTIKKAEKLVENGGVVKIEDDLLYLGQGGNQIKKDDIFTIYERTDSKIKDTYTGETLGNVEKIVGKATIIDSNAKFSVAQIIEQKYDLSEDFKPRKYMVKPIIRKYKTKPKAINKKTEQELKKFFRKDVKSLEKIGVETKLWGNYK